MEVSLERSVREERFAHVRLVGARGAWGAWGGGGALGGSGLGAGAGQRMGFKYDPRALREAVFGGTDGAAGEAKRRKVERVVEEGGEHTKDQGEAKREEQAREDVVLLECRCRWKRWQSRMATHARHAQGLDLRLEVTEQTSQIDILRCKLSNCSE